MNDAPYIRYDNAWFVIFRMDDHVYVEPFPSETAAKMRTLELRGFLKPPRHESITYISAQMVWGKFA